MAKLAIDIRSVLIPITGHTLLLPNATVAEVITYTQPDSFEDAPSWVLGRVTWRGWRVPVVSISMLGRWAGSEQTSGAKIAVLKGLGGNADMPFMAIVTQGFPRLVTVNPESMMNQESAGHDQPGPESAPEAPEPELPAAEPLEGEQDDELEAFSVEMDIDQPAPWDDVAEDEPPPAPDEERPGNSRPPDAAGESVPDAPEDFEAVAATVQVEGESAVIPDLLAIERLVVRIIGRDVLRGGG